ncbi:GTP cyclohydrolase [Formosa sediminum]|uniref:GTP cyclohydrolase n=1 Tax=Formosa sediminum TaxID=2594004 RepID=A0A516GU54_9FLAO|nr:GTP cyclohydrolase [Formosa sediminum]QDO95054.1 GTP cyclohydrolase [Formosa sediminum]
MIILKEVQTKKELKDFVKFPFELYKGSPYWVPPIISQEMEVFNKDKNPIFNDASATLYVALKDHKIVGRIAIIINKLDLKQSHNKIRFGWFDVIDDIEVTKALLDKVNEIGKANNLEYMEGPIGFSNLDKVGVLTEGYDHIGSMITWYNYPYYVEHLVKLGLVQEKEYQENKFPFSNVKPEFFKRMNELVKKRYGLRPLNFTKTEDLMPYVDQMFDLFNTSYSELASFVEITEIQKAYFKKKFISFINPEFIKFVMDENDNMIAFAVVMPSFAEALQKANGKLFPFGFLHLLKAKKECKTVSFYLIGVEPKYKNKGVTAIIFNEYYETLKPLGVKYCIRTPELEENFASHQIWKHFKATTYKRRKTYRKNLE